MSLRIRAVVFLSFVVMATPFRLMAQQKSSATSPATRTAKVAEMKLGRIAPTRPLFLLVTNGWAAPDPQSKNKSELLWAEESVQDFMKQLGDEIQKTVQQKADQDEASTVLAASIPVLLKAAVQHPMAVSLVNFTTTAVPDVDFSIVIDTESDAANVRQAFEKLIKMAPKSGPDSLTEESIDGVTFYHPQGNPNDGFSQLLPRFGMFESYLIVTVGANTASETLTRIRGSAKGPAWFESMLSEMKIERPTFAMSLDGEAIWKKVDGLIQDPKVKATLDASGVMGIKRIVSVSGLDAVGTVDKFVLETSGAPKGVLALIPEKPILPKDLRTIPANPASAMLMRLDLKQMVEGILKITDQADPTIRMQFDQFSAQVEPMLGFSLKGDLFEAFGDLWCSYVSGTEAGGGMVPGMVFTASVRDQKKLTKIQDALIVRARQALQQMGPQAPVSLTDFTAKNFNGFRVQINNLPIPIAPAWVMTKDEFVLGLSPQLVTSHLGASTAKTTLADHPDVKSAISRNPKSIMVSFRDPKPEIQGYYTLVNTLSPMGLGYLKQQGIDFNLPPLPPFSDIEPHLAPSVTTMSREPKGWSSETRGVMPSMSMTSTPVIAVSIALLLPAVQQAREAARRTQAKNNLKQIGLAMHNFHDANRQFPARVTLDKNKKAGLSWRVKILPYLDQQALFSEFHHDEPWDSDHNKTLISKMPNVYLVPGSNHPQSEGKTQYQVLKGAGTLFHGDEGPKIASITDGTSNTIMAVETHADAAVIWTKPDDLEVDFDKPATGLTGAWMGGFHVLMADGSVRFISDKINAQILKSLFTKAGGEVVGEY